MARRAPARYKSGPKKGQFKPKGATTKRTTTRRRKRSTSSRKRRTYRRRRNPGGKLDVKGNVLAAAGGAVVGAANYGLDGVEQITNTQQAWGVAIGGLVLGMIASTASKPLGMGIAGGALALGGYKLAGIYVQKKPAQNGANGEATMGQIARGYGGGYRAGYGAPNMLYPAYRGATMGGTTAELAAIQAQMSAVEADLGAVEADLGAVEADLGQSFDDWQMG